MTGTLRRMEPDRQGQEETVRARYVVGCDGSHSSVRQSIGRSLVGDVANQAGAFEQFLYSQNQQFDAAGDVNGDGRIDSQDMFALRTTYQQGGASQAVKNELELAIRRRADVTQDVLGDDVVARPEEADERRDAAGLHCNR